MAKYPQLGNSKMVIKSKFGNRFMKTEACFNRVYMSMAKKRELGLRTMTMEKYTALEILKTAKNQEFGCIITVMAEFKTKGVF